ncbi:hypothetical protein F4782DRAFT_477216 [Xylaria castorea]|nr:hypothetical protein F4782DRAFT_477216 [Xylaria castorea]
MATNPYEVEHDIKPVAARRHRRRPDMSTFNAHLDNITPGIASSHAGPTPVDVEGVFQLVQDQMATLAATAPTEENRQFLSSLSESLEGEERITGVDHLYLDNLDRVSRKKLQSNPTDACPICAEKFLDDPHPLVVELPCHGSHKFDLECVGPWLLSKGTCPMCRKDLTVRETHVYILLNSLKIGQPSIRVPY